MRLSTRDFWLAVLAAFIWGATFPISAIALESMPPIFFTFLRFSCASIFVVLIPRPAVPFSKLIAIGLLLGVGQYSFMFVSMANGMPAGLASLLVHTQAFFTIAIAMLIFSERLSKRQICALSIAAPGLAFLIVDQSQSGSVVGLALMLIAALCGAFGNILLKSLRQVDTLGVAVWMSLAAPLPLLLLSLLTELNGSVVDLVSTISWKTAGAVAYSAIFATVLAYAIWGRLLSTYSSVLVAPFFLLVPVFGLGLSALVLGEHLSMFQIFGVISIFIGLALALWPKHDFR